MVFSAPPTVNCGGPAVHDLVKRVIALPGETISLSGGRVYINGQRLDESWLPASLQDVTFPGPSTESYSLHRADRVPFGTYYMLGDNRTDSCDSRYWGSVPQSDMIGVVPQGAAANTTAP